MFVYFVGWRGELYHLLSKLSHILTANVRFRRPLWFGALKIYAILFDYFYLQRRVLLDRGTFKYLETNYLVGVESKTCKYV